MFNNVWCLFNADLMWVTKQVPNNNSERKSKQCGNWFDTAHNLVSEIVIIELNRWYHDGPLLYFSGYSTIENAMSNYCFSFASNDFKWKFANNKKY